LRLGARNGSLYLVTGVDKCRNWCLAAYSDASGRGFPLRFTAPNAAATSGASQYSWESSNSVEARTCPVLADDNSRNQCVFIRGYKLAVSETLYERSLVGPVNVSDIVTSTPGDVLANGRNIPGMNRGVRWISWLLGRAGRDPSTPAEGVDISVESFPNIPNVCFSRHYSCFHSSDSFISHTILHQ
jgi:hypothetical protein